ncbi:gas vesicle protein [Clostridium saccharoperbutylacetonicum]|uniref:Uncharacterized protein n=1 Tax=Clostridium saccharoperbutylacetonicum N1-4(HMT) TaxID=931276 RepID=M1MK76_9CLOT|nr:hypothetical protein [Clostridium saccharoperbutylacetonicum]AGF58309.1 hypothetical protein Cspa_c45560 [Clostridium saccharoperbutylacetonicum N1-4(HMT)]NRT60914.1 gas vesicle protein [Clostridium saccharoperbutylacetonicum]NSB24227.1 gas vesicle protein [Clostridium saccharoperbutylacetonicum]NSB43605.1 gas vesicle protein [Clostridium saccharoperbutylacetonicum]
MKKGIVSILSTVAGVAIGAGATTYLANKSKNQQQGCIERYTTYYNMLNQWLILKTEGRSLEEYFKENNYNKVAIYGMGELGCRLYEDLKDTSIEVKYCIDRNLDGVYSELDVFSLDDELEEVDAIVVSPVYDFEVIEKNISEKVDYSVISLEDVIYAI